jgi:hypothetical protein
VFLPNVWRIKVPPKIQMFLWVLSHSKLATVDNLNKKGMDKQELCLFCCEKKSIKHLFFECSNEKWGTVNIISTTVLRGIWLTHNDFVFNGQVWSDVKLLLRKIWKLSMEWKILCTESLMEMMERWLTFLEQQISEPLKISSA